MRAANVLHLGVKELRGLARDPMLLALIVLAFTLSVYSAATAMPEVLHKAPIAIIDEDGSPLSARVLGAFDQPYFLPPDLISPVEADAGLDAGLFTFALDLPPDFQRDVLAGEAPAVQLSVDATRVSQALSGAGYVQAIVEDEVRELVRRHREAPAPPVELSLRARFNPALDPSWFGAVMQVINQVTMLSIVLTGAALIRERESGTLEHLMVMPVTPAEVMTSKVWSMALVVLVACALSVELVVKGLLSVPIEGSVPLFLAGAALHLFATTSMGIYLASRARTTPQFGLLLILVMVPLQMLSGGSTPRESMPEVIQVVMQVAPTTHFVQLAQAILYRGAGLSVVWPHLLALIVIGAVLFGLSLASFRRTLVSSS